MKCPECGRENVSDSAESCPECGYPIRSYFEKLKKQQLETQENIKQKQNREEKLNELAKNVKIPTDKPQLHLITYLGIFLLLLDILFILLTLGIIKGDGSGGSIGMVLLTSVFGFGSVYAGYSDYKEQKDECEKISKNPEEFRRQMALKEYNKMVAKTSVQTKTIEDVPNRSVKNESIKCPKCRSTQIQLVNRRWSPITGLLTNKVDRVCLKCKNRF